jgi:hypothetical protein
MSVRAARLAETVAGTPDKSHFHNVANGEMGVVPRQNIVHPQNQRLGAKLDSYLPDKILAMIVSLRHLFGCSSFLRASRMIDAENFDQGCLRFQFEP